MHSWEGETLREIETAENKYLITCNTSLYCMSMYIIVTADHNLENKAPNILSQK